MLQNYDNGPSKPLILGSTEWDHRNAYTRRTIHNTNTHVVYTIKRTIQAKLYFYRLVCLAKGSCSLLKVFLIIINSDYLNTINVVGLDLQIMKTMWRFRN